MYTIFAKQNYAGEYNLKNRQKVAKMSGNLLPEWVNLFLDDFETSLCLPILVVMILCTAQFVFNHIFDVVQVIYQNVRGPETEGAQNKNDMMGRLKGLM